MANTESAKKQMRSNERRRLRNRVHIGRARSEVKRAREAISSGDLSAATEAVRLAAKWLDHAASKGSIHPNNAARRKGRLMAQLVRMDVRPVAAAPVEEAVEPPAKASRASKPKAAKPKAEKAAKAEKPAKEEKAPRARAKKTTKEE